MGKPKGKIYSRKHNTEKEILHCTVGIPQHSNRGHRSFTCSAPTGSSFEIQNSHHHHPESNIAIESKLKEKQLIQKSYYDRQTRCLPELYAGEKVRIQKGQEWQPAVIVNRHKQPRSFIVQTPDGRIDRRNRKHLLKTGEKEFATSSADADINVRCHSLYTT